MKRICLLGSFSGRNIGDDAILRGMINFFNLAKIDFRLIVLTKFPKYFYGFSPNVTPARSKVGLLSLNTFWELFHADIILIPQGSLFSYKLFNPFYNRVLPYYLITIINSAFAKKPIGLFLGGIGPITNKISSFFIKKIIEKLDFLLFRDALSISLLQNLGVEKEYAAASDIALFCPRENTEFVQKIKEQIGKRNVLGINICKYTSEFLHNKNTTDNLLSPLISFLQEKKDSYYYLFMPSDIEDINQTKMIITEASLKEDSYLLIEKCKPEEYIEIQSICDFFIGTRMHSLIMSAVAGTPFIGLNYNPKVKDFMELTAVSSYCIEYNETALGSLNKVFAEMVKYKSELRDLLKQNVHKQKQAITLGINEKVLCYLK